MTIKEDSMKEKYSTPFIKIEVLEKTDVLCGSQDENDNLNYQQDSNNLIRFIANFEFI